jgi:CRISPR system Cascade subunit CasD
MQSWGVQSRFSVRDTALEPSKSGIVGMLCAALGRGRSVPVSDLASLDMAVRVEREGRVSRDYHTAQGVGKADGGPVRATDTVLSQRYYLADADFLVGVAGEPGLLLRLAAALQSPVWALSLGRKSFVPSEPVYVGLRDDTRLRDALVSHPWRPQWDGGRDPQIRYVWEVPYGQGEPRGDVPVSFASRTFSVRHVMVRSAPPGVAPREWEGA